MKFVVETWDTIPAFYVVLAAILFVAWVVFVTWKFTAKRRDKLADSILSFLGIACVWAVALAPYLLVWSVDVDSKIKVGMATHGVVDAERDSDKIVTGTKNGKPFRGVLVMDEKIVGNKRTYQLVQLDK